MTIDKDKAVRAQRLAAHILGHGYDPMFDAVTESKERERHLLTADQLRELFDELDTYKDWHVVGSRKNVAQTEHGVRICHGDHEKHEPCEWVDYVAASKHAELEAERDRYKAALEFIASSSNCGTCDACLRAAKDALKP